MSGISAQYVNGLEFRIKELGEQVEKLENRLNKDSQEFTILCAKETEKVLREQLAALAEQNGKMREALEMIVVSSLTHPRVSAYADKALSLPDLASPVLNSIPKEPTLPVFDADSPRFRQVFDEAVQAHNLPGKRKGEGYRSPITQWCFEIAYSVVNRLRLYEK